MIDVPEIIRTYWYAVDWDAKALWALDLPVEPLAIAELVWQLDAPVWSDGEADYTVTPLAVLADPERHATLHARMNAADISYPIEVTFLKDRWLVLDGIHRLLKCHRDGAAVMFVRKVPVESLSPWEG